MHVFPTISPPNCRELTQDFLTPALPHIQSGKSCYSLLYKNRIYHLEAEKSKNILTIWFLTIQIFISRKMLRHHKVRDFLDKLYLKKYDNEDMKDRPVTFISTDSENSKANIKGKKSWEICFQSSFICYIADWFSQTQQRTNQGVEVLLLW